mmetsp:Transcript_15216/g.22884  ORF Transcript_15216/g.22884 Transcript_15216/m.22884 type:complete len:289 (+) Transcript_15216:37-903(+)
MYLRELLLFTLIITIQSLLSNHTFVDISGWPHSGTSVVHEIFKYVTDASTFFPTCGEQCRRFNYEGQWKLSEKVSKVYRPGVYCSLRRSHQVDSYSSLVSEWSQLWDMNKSMLVQKSPADLLKIPFLHHAFDAAGEKKYIIVIKHPSSISNALPRGATWMTHAEKGDYTLHKKRNMGDVHVRMPLWKSVTHFVNMMERNDLDYIGKKLPSDRKPTSPHSCANTAGKGLSWLSTMETLHGFLSSNWTFSERHIRIVRYEDFIDKGFNVCVKLIQFASSSPSKTHAKEVG